MARVSLSEQARRDVRSILESLSDTAGALTARRFDTSFKNTIERLAEFPGIGAMRPALGAATRVVSVNPYLIFYDGGPDSETVQVLRILHGRRNITPELIARGRAD
jgi:plasmid stabilization system protein ParE